MQRSTQRRPRVASFLSVRVVHAPTLGRIDAPTETITSPSLDRGCRGRLEVATMSPIGGLSAQLSYQGELGPGFDNLQQRPRSCCLIHLTQMTALATRRSLISIAVSVVAALALSACGGGGGGSPVPPPATYTVGGAVNGLTGSGLVLQENGGADLTVAADGSFAFAPPLATWCCVQRDGQDQPTIPGRPARSPTAQAPSWRPTSPTSPSPAAPLRRDLPT